MSTDLLLPIRERSVQQSAAAGGSGLTAHTYKIGATVVVRTFTFVAQACSNNRYYFGVIVFIGCWNEP